MTERAAPQGLLPRVKICGLTSLEDALHAVSCGADALGFVFYEKSPRHLGTEAAGEIIRALPPFVTTVGLFVNESPQRIRETVAACGLDVIQLHGDEGPEEAHFPPLRVIKALRVKDEASLADAGAYPVSALLLDAWSADSYGGTGHRFSWELAARLAQEQRIILAGGLTPENVAAAIAAVQPYGVDVSSGVESAPGRKDPAKVAAFVRNAKSKVV